MPSLKPSSVPSYRRHKQSGQAIVTLSGRDHLLGPHNSKQSRQKYDRLIAEWLANGRRSPHCDQDNVTVSRVIAEYWSYAQSYYVNSQGESTGEAEHFRVAMGPLRRLYGATRAADFGPLAFKAVQQEMIRMGWCRRYINHQASRVKQGIRNRHRPKYPGPPAGFQHH